LTRRRFIEGFGGYLPVERTTEISSLKHRGNLVHKGKKMRHIVIYVWKRYKQIPQKNGDKGASNALGKFLAPLTGRKRTCAELLDISEITTQKKFY
jgi:hypothetical protein